MGFCFFVEVKQHDHKEEQYHDGTGVNDQVNNRQKVGVQQDVVSCDGEKEDHEP
jgi:hypothetical protein